MSATIPAVVTAIGALFGLAGLAGGLTAYFKSRLLDQNLTILERTNKAQDERIKFLEEQDERKTKDLGEKDKAIKVLTEVVTGHEQLTTILEAIRAHDERIVTRDIKLFNDLEEILDIMTQIKDRVSLRRDRGDDR